MNEILGVLGIEIDNDIDNEINADIYADIDYHFQNLVSMGLVFEEPEEDISDASIPDDIETM